MKTTSRTPRRAFTLVELLAALAILAMLMTIIFGVFNQASKAWLLAENRTENFQGARMALDLMCRDLECAVTGTNGAPGFRSQAIRFLTFEDFGTVTIPAIGAGLATVGTFTSQGGMVITPPNDALYFVTQAPDSRGQTYGSLAECGYFVLYCPSGTAGGMGKPGHYYLYRHYVRSTNVSTGAPNPDWDFLSNPGNWWLPATGGDAPLLDNAIRLEFKYEFADSSVVTYGTSPLTDWNGPGFLGIYSFDPTIRLPRAIHIQLSVLDRRYAAQLAALALNGSGPSSTDMQNIPFHVDAIGGPVGHTLKEGMRTFYRSVYPRGAY